MGTSNQITIIDDGSKPHEIGKTINGKKHKTGGKEKTVYKLEIVWFNLIVMTLLHVCAFYGMYLRYFEAKRPSTLLFKVYGTLSILGITSGAHRLWTHRTYTANLAAEIMIACMASMTFQNSIYIWCRDHRLHHKSSETDGDPHNANRGFFFSHMGWLLVRKHDDVKRIGKTIDMSDLEANPVIMFQHRYNIPITFVVTFAITTLVPWYFWNESLRVSFFAITVYRFLLANHITWCINSFAHLYGIKPYDRHIGPTENIPMRYIALGEGFHNYHHTFPFDYKTSELGNDVRNPTTMFIDLLASLGLVTDRKTAPASIIEKRKTNTGDGTSHSSDKYSSYTNAAILLLYFFVV